MAYMKGRERVSRLLRVTVPEALAGDSKLLRGAARAAGDVLAEEARDRCVSDLVKGRIVVRVRQDNRSTKAVVTVRGRWAASVGKWLEWGTSKHFISVDDEVRGGRGVMRINQQLGSVDGDASLVIGGKFVGRTVLHPGASPHPFLRPALDVKRREAIAAAHNHITSRMAGRASVSEDSDV